MQFMYLPCHFYYKLYSYYFLFLFKDIKRFFCNAHINILFLLSFFLLFLYCFLDLLLPSITGVCFKSSFYIYIDTFLNLFHLWKFIITFINEYNHQYFQRIQLSQTYEFNLY